MTTPATPIDIQAIKEILHDFAYQVAMGYVDPKEFVEPHQETQEAANQLNQMFLDYGATLVGGSPPHQGKGKNLGEVFGMPVKTFDEDNLLQEMLDAEEGTVFMLGEKRTPNHEGDDTVEQTFVQIMRTRDSAREVGAQRPAHPRRDYGAAQRIDELQKLVLENNANAPMLRLVQDRIQTLRGKEMTEEHKLQHNVDYCYVCRPVPPKP